MNDTTWLRQIPYGGYQVGSQPTASGLPFSVPRPPPGAFGGYYPPSPHLPQSYVGQYADPNRPPPGASYGYGPLDEMKPIGTTLALAAVAFVLFGGIGAALGYLIHPSTKGAAVGAYLGLAALQGSSAIRRS